MTKTADDAPAQAWNVPARSRVFTGREGMLTALREQLCTHRTAAVLALHGLGGVGKTTLATEYAHRHAADYAIAWWIDAEQTGLIGEQLAALGLAAGWLTTVSDIPVATREVFSQLHGRNAWLIVFDNCESPDDMVRWLPQGPGHVLVTSRNPSWRQVAEPIEVDVFDRTESVALLQRLVPELALRGAHLIADGVGDLPLAVAQAAGALAETGMTSDEYLGCLTLHTAKVLAEGKPPAYPTVLSAAVQLSMDRLVEEDRAGAQLLHLCSILAPEPIPVEFFTAAASGDLPLPLASVTSAILPLRCTLGRIGRYGLAKIRPVGPQMHRLVQAIIVDHLDADDRGAVRAQAERILVAAAPPDSRDPVSWPLWVRFMPHLLAMGPATTDSRALRAVAWEASWYLLQRGDLRAAREFAKHLHQHWGRRLGPDDPDTLGAAYNVASVNWRLGQYTEAHALAEDTFSRRRIVHGANHVRTLSSADQVASLLRKLGYPADARSLHEDTLRRLREIRGENSRLTLGVAHNLALDLYELGRFQEALSLNRHVLNRRRRVLGNDHPHTLLSACDFTRDLHHAGHHIQALQLITETLTHCREVLGHDHPDTLDAASIMAMLLHDGDRFEEALELREDVFSQWSRVLGDNHPKTLQSAVDLQASVQATDRRRA